MDENLLPDEKTENLGRLTILLFKGGTKALKNILFRLLLQKILDQKKDDIKSQVGTNLTQPQFDKLFPATGQPPNLEEIDMITMVILQQMLSIQNSSGDTKRSIIKYVLNDGLKRHLKDTRKDFLKIKNHIKKQWEQLYPQSSSVDGDTFDITLLACIIRTSFDVTPSSGNWTDHPFAGDTNLADDICRIRICRNDICHMKHYGIDEKEFNEKWQDIENVLTRILGFSYQTDIEKLKVAPLSPKPVEEYQALMEDWIKQEKEIMDCLEELHEGQERIKEGISAVHDDVREIKDMIYQNRQEPGQQPDTELKETKDTLQQKTQQVISDPTTKKQSQKHILQKNYDYLRDNVDIDTVLPKLVSKCAISFEDNDKVKAERTKADKVQQLITILLRKPPDAIEEFFNAVDPYIEDKLRSTDLSDVKNSSELCGVDMPRGTSIPYQKSPELKLDSGEVIPFATGRGPGSSVDTHQGTSNLYQRDQEQDRDDEDILQDGSESPKFLARKRECRLENKHLQAFANTLKVAKVKAIGLALGLEENEIDAVMIDNDKYDVDTQIVYMFQKWLTKQGTMGTVEALETLLRKAKKNGIEIDLDKLREAVNEAIYDY